MDVRDPTERLYETIRRSQNKFLLMIANACLYYHLGNWQWLRTYMESWGNLRLWRWTRKTTLQSHPLGCNNSCTSTTNWEVWNGWNHTSSRARTSQPGTLLSLISYCFHYCIINSISSLAGCRCFARIIVIKPYSWN